MQDTRFYSKEYKHKYIANDEMRRMSYVIEYLDDAGAVQIGCVHYFLLLEVHGSTRHLVAATAPMEGVAGGAPEKHPKYTVSKLCRWPPRPFPSVYVMVEKLLRACVVVYLRDEVCSGGGVAHITNYVHKVAPNTKSWYQ